MLEVQLITTLSDRIDSIMRTQTLGEKVYQLRFEQSIISMVFEISPIKYFNHLLQPWFCMTELTNVSWKLDWDL